VLYIPIGIWAYVAAGQDHVLSPAVIVLSAAVGAGLLALALLIPRFGPRMRYPDVEIPDARSPVAVSVDELVAT
jgi:hydrogenase/urease accessory protein HupE